MQQIQSGDDIFAHTMRGIGEYIAMQYKGGREFMWAVDPDVLEFDPLVDTTTMPPTDPTAPRCGRVSYGHTMTT